MNRTSVRRSAFAIGLLCLLATGFGMRTSRADEKPSVEERWQVVFLGPQRIGFSRSTSETFERDGSKVFRNVEDTSMTLKRFGQELRSRMVLSTEEAEDGSLLSFELREENPPLDAKVTSGRVVGEQMQIEQTAAGQTQKRSIPWDKSVKGPDFPARSLKESPLKSGESRSFKTFFVEYQQVTDLTVTFEGRDVTPVLGGTTRELVKLKQVHSIIPKQPSWAWLDEEGTILKSRMDIAGQAIIAYDTTKDEALREVSGGELDLAIDGLIPIDRLPRGYDTQRAIYRIRTKGGDPAESLGTADNQQLKRIDNETVELTVTASKLLTPGTDAPAKPQYLKSTHYISVSDENVQKLAREAAGDASDPVEVARRMETFVRDRLTSKNFSSALATSAEVARNLQGDCTEHSVLLAAMLRARQIPSRIVVGLVYVPTRTALCGHMWTEVWIGDRWFPLDGTLGRGGVTAGHIKLGDSAMDDETASPLLAFKPLLDILGNIEIKLLEAE